MHKVFTNWQMLLLVAGGLTLTAPVPGVAQRRTPPARTTTAPAPAPQPTQTAPTTQSPAPTTPAPTTAAPKPGPQGAQGAQTDKNKVAKGAYRLRLTASEPRTVSLNANAAPMTQIAAELSRKLTNTPVVLSPVMQQAKITLDFAGVPLEGALRMMAPQVYIDYEISGDGAVPAKIIGIYLHGLNEPPPAESTLVRGDSEAILIEGNTEDGTEGTESAQQQQEKTLSVKVDQHQLTVRARRQPLTAVLYEVASKVDIPFEMKYESSEVVDADYSNYTLEQLVRALSPNIRLYQRTDLSNYETKPLRLVLAPPSSTQQTRM